MFLGTALGGVRAKVLLDREPAECSRCLRVIHVVSLARVLPDEVASSGNMFPPFDLLSFIFRHAIVAAGRECCL